MAKFDISPAELKIIEEALWERRTVLTKKLTEYEEKDAPECIVDLIKNKRKAIISLGIKLGCIM